MDSPLVSCPDCAGSQGTNGFVMRAGHCRMEWIPCRTCDGAGAVTPKRAAVAARSHAVRLAIRYAERRGQPAAIFCGPAFARRIVEAFDGPLGLNPLTGRRIVCGLGVHTSSVREMPPDRGVVAWQRAGQHGGFVVIGVPSDAQCRCTHAEFEHDPNGGCCDDACRCLAFRQQVAPDNAPGLTRCGVCGHPRRQHGGYGCLCCACLEKNWEAWKPAASEAVAGDVSSGVAAGTVRPGPAEAPRRKLPSGRRGLDLEGT
jgi:hypothetical protein